MSDFMSDSFFEIDVPVTAEEYAFLEAQADRLHCTVNDLVLKSLTAFLDEYPDPPQAPPNE